MRQKRIKKENNNNNITSSSSPLLNGSSKVLSQSLSMLTVPLVSPNENDSNYSDGGGASERKRKKARTTFTGRQIFELERQFECKKYLSSSERSELAKLLGVTETQVRLVHVLLLFQNRVAKMERECLNLMKSDEMSFNKVNNFILYLEHNICSRFNFCDEYYLSQKLN
ncbi:hypothetical protein WDU94_013723 [Cyamophila willieti]